MAMPSLLQRRLRCFYCGRRSTPAPGGRVREFKCNDCEAVNYLDEKGEITDPPCPPQSEEARDAQAPLPDYTSSALFCRKCLQNQQIVMNLMSNYEPPQTPNLSAGDQDAYFQAYRTELEDRYPQVCLECEPRVRERIRQAGYAAKTDHLRRMMDQGRRYKARQRTQASNWRSYLVSAGALAYWTSIVGQLLWNIMGYMAAGQPIPDATCDLSVPSVVGCIQQGLRTCQVDTCCVLMLEPLARFAVALGFVSIWWNPKLRYKVEQRSGRLAGLTEYYQIQLITLVVRFVGWGCLGFIHEDRPDTLPAFHVCMAVITILGVIGCRRAVKFNKNRLTLFKDPEPLVASKPAGPQARQAKQLWNPPALQTSASDLWKHGSPFPIDKLAPNTKPSSSYIPPTPPNEGPDSMDWAPTHTLRPQRTAVSQEQPEAPLPAPSPFQGQLPAAPKPPAWTLRNPPVIRPPAPVEKANPFLHTYSNKPDVNQTRKQTDMAFAPPSFFPKSDFAETGLERLFDSAFNIRDQNESGKAQNTSAQMQRNSKDPTILGDRILRMFNCALLVISSAIWAFADKIPLSGVPAEVLVPGATFLVAGLSVIETLAKPAAHWSLSDMFIFVLELLTSGFCVGHRLRGFYHPFIDKMGNALLVIMMVQELYQVMSKIDTQPKSSLKQGSQKPESPNKAKKTIPSQTETQARLQMVHQSPGRLESAQSSLNLDMSLAPALPPRTQCPGRYESPLLQPQSFGSSQRYDSPLPSPSVRGFRGDSPGLSSEYTDDESDDGYSYTSRMTPVRRYTPSVTSHGRSSIKLGGLSLDDDDYDFDNGDYDRDPPSPMAEKSSFHRYPLRNRRR